MATRKAARKRTDQWVEDPEYGTLLELEPIEVEGSVSRANAIELEPIDIQGSRSADAQPFSPDEGFVPGAQPPARRADGVSTMLPDFVPSWVTDVTGQPVRGMGGTTDYEIPEWAAEFVADSEGQMPRDSFDVATALTANLIPGYLPYRMLTGTAPTPESRTVSPEAAALGVAEGGSMGFADEILGLLDDEAADEYRRERATTQRQNPGSFAMGDAAGGAALGLLAPAASAGRGATTLARGGLAALEGGAYGLLEGVGRSDADTLSGRLEDAIPGAVGGAVLGGGLGAGSRYMEQRAAQPVDQRGIDEALDAAAWERLSQAGANQALTSRRQHILAPGTTEQARTQSARRTVDILRGEGVFDSGPLGLPAGPETIQRRIAERMPAASNTIGTTTQRMEGQLVDTQPLLTHVEQRLAELDAIPGAEAQANAMRSNLARFREAAANGVTFDELQRWKTFWRQNTNFDAPLQSDRQGIYGAISDTMQRGVEDVDPALGQQYREARNMYRIGSAFEEAGGDQVRNDARLRRVSLTDYLSGLEGFREGGVLGGITGIVLNKGLRRNEHALRAMSLERTARRLQQAPERFGRYAGMLRAAQERGPQAFAAALYIAQQNDASVRAAVAEEEDVQGMRDAGAQEQQESAAFDEFLRTQAEEDAAFQRFLEGQQP